MVRSLWSAATGMKVQQTAVDVIANNLANGNTTGYKTERAEFKSLLYQTMQTKTTSSDGTQKPINAQVGLGVRNAAIRSTFKQGNFNAVESDTAFAINGDGFFALQYGDSVRYTRNGDFTWAIASNGYALTSSDGSPVLDDTGKPIVVSGDYNMNKIGFSQDGSLCYPDDTNNMQPIGIRIGLYQFNNPSGLTRVGDSSYEVSAASGEAINEATNANVRRSVIAQGYIEQSNVQVADEMVNLIVSQRAYEMNSKAITTTDTMMEQANNLKR